MLLQTEIYTNMSGRKNKMNEEKILTFKRQIENKKLNQDNYYVKIIALT